MKRKSALKNHSASRRDFVKKSAIAASAVVAGCSPKVADQVQRTATAPAAGSVLGANDRIRLGFIGVGGQGFNSHLVNIVNQGDDGAPRHEYDFNAVGVAAVDIFDKRRDQALQEMRKVNPDAEVYSDYRAVLDRDDIDAVFIGTVDHWHTRIALDAMDAGKHVYCEKPMTRYFDEAFQIHDKVKETGNIFQIGSQYCTEGKWHTAAQLIQAGKIGPLVLGQADYCRNNPDGEWNYEIDEDANPQHIDWSTWLGPVSDRPFSADEYHRWRKYYPYCAGILGDLLAHRIHPLLIATGSPEFPTRVACLGTRQVTPDRDVPDNTQILANFPGGLTILVIGSTINEQGLGQVIRGHEGTLYFGGNTVEIRPERPFADLVDREQHDNIQPGVSIPAHIADWVTAMRDNRPPNGNIDVAIRAQVIISMAEMSERLGEMLYFDENTRRITTGGGDVVNPITYGTLELS